MRYLIIGGGIAGTTASEEIRKMDPNSEITIVSAEEHRLYSRVLLPRYIKGTLSRERCFLKTDAWYQEQNIERVTACVEAILPREKCVTLDNGRELQFDKLLIATSGPILKLSHDFHGISYLRTIDDADHLIGLLDECETQKGRAAIVGGSFIAVEYLNFFAQRKIPADLFMLEDTLFGGTLDDASFAVLRRQIEGQGINIHPSSAVSSVGGNGRIENVKSGEKSFSISLLAVGIGIRADHQLFRSAGIEANLGVVANEFLETNVPGIYAAGDVAEFYDTLAGRPVIVGNWLNAQAQGRTVAKTMAGERTAFSAVRAYSTNVCGIEVIFIGDTDKKHIERTVIRGSLEENGVTQIFIRDRRVVGATLVNRNSDRARVTEMIRDRLSADEI